MKTKAIIGIVFLAAALPVTAATVVNVAPSGTIIDSSGAFDNWLGTDHVIDGVVSEAANGAASYWLAPAGAATAYFILDLRQSCTISSVSLYNTHNRGTNDSGTAAFTLTASDEIGPNIVSLDRYYGLDSDVNDQSPNAVHASMLDVWMGFFEPVFSNDIPAAVTAGSKSLYLSGSGEHLQIPDPPGFAQPVEYSYALWVKFLTNDFQPALRATSLILRTATPGGERTTWSHQLRLNAAGKFQAYTWVGFEATVTGTTTVQPNVWYHVACTAANGGMLRLYVNGVEEGTPSPVATMWAGGAVTAIGTGSGGGYEPAAELMDELGIWYSALSPDRVRLLSQGHSPATVGGARGYVLLNPKTVAAGTLADVSGQDEITPAVYNLSTPVTARYFRFDALSPITVYLGLNELRLMGEATTPELTVAPALELSWLPTPFARAPFVTRDLGSGNWVQLADTPSWAGNKLRLFQELTNTAAYYLIPAPAGGGTVATNVATVGSIVSASSVYSAMFNPGHVIDGATDEAAQSAPSYWLASDGVTEADFVLDLGASYFVKSVSLFNTHNRGWNDRGTAGFELQAASSMGATETEAGLARLYALNSDLSDGSGNQVPASFLDGPLGNEIPGEYSDNVPSALGGGQSMVFSDTEARLEIADPPGFLQPAEYSISLWIKCADLNLPRSVIVRTASSGQELVAWSHQLRITGNGQFQAYTFDGTEVYVTGTTFVEPGKWYHVVVTARNGGFMHLYVNGKEEGTKAPVSALWAGGGRWSIGTGSGHGYSPFVGQVDHLAMWFGVLPVDAIQALSTGASPTALKAMSSPPPQLVNPTLIASGFLGDVSNQDQISPDTFPLALPANARFLQFRTLSSTYGTGNVGLNEIQVIADVTPGGLSAAPAVLLAWPYGPIRMALQSSSDGQNWNAVADVPTLSGLTYKVFRPGQEGVAYRLVPQ